MEREVLQHESNGLALRNINKNHPRRLIRASAPAVTSIRADRYEHPRRSMRMTKVGSNEEGKRWGEKGEEEREAEERGVRTWGRGVRGYGRDAIPS